MFSAEMLAKMTPEQRRRMAVAAAQAKELKRQALCTPMDRMIRQGLQIANITLDFRTGEARASHLLLFYAGYHNRYHWAINNKDQPGLVGWTPAMREFEKRIKRLTAYS